MKTTMMTARKAMTARKINTVIRLVGFDLLLTGSEVYAVRRYFAGKETCAEFDALSSAVREAIDLTTSRLRAILATKAGR